MTKVEKTLFAFLFALTTCGALFLIYELIMYLYSIFGMMALIGTIVFIGVWCVWYVIIDDELEGTK